MKMQPISVAALIVTALFSLAVSAAPHNAQDLVGMKAKNADPQLQSRGYVRVGTERSDKNHSWGMWWNQSSRQCLTVAYARGKVEAITDAPEFDCKQDQHHSSSNNQGYHQQAEYTDLNGARASSANDALEQRGFNNVDGFKSGTTAYTIWYNYNTGQCLQMTVGDGRVVDISDIHEHDNCR